MVFKRVDIIFDMYLENSNKATDRFGRKSFKSKISSINTSIKFDDEKLPKILNFSDLQVKTKGRLKFSS